MSDTTDSPLDRLSADDVETVRQCLAAAVMGPFFPDWEFATLFGLKRDEVAQVLRRWPDSANPETQDVAVTNTLNHLLGYPHRQERAWPEFIAVPKTEVAAVLGRWSGADDLDQSARGYFDRMR